MAKKQLTWREITLLGVGLEFMLHVQEDGKLIGLYTGREMKNQTLEWYGSGDDPNEYSFEKWEPKNNELYIHCPTGIAKFNALKAMALSGELLLCGEVEESDETYQDWQDDREYMLKLISYYGLDELFKKYMVGDDVFSLGS